VVLDEPDRAVLRIINCLLPVSTCRSNSFFSESFCLLAGRESRRFRQVQEAVRLGATIAHKIRIFMTGEADRRAEGAVAVRFVCGNPTNLSGMRVSGSHGGVGSVIPWSVPPASSAVTRSLKRWCKLFARLSLWVQMRYFLFYMARSCAAQGFLHRSQPLTGQLECKPHSACGLR
jgi:hypothetical protein